MLVSDNVQKQLLELLAKETARQPAPESEQRSASHLQLNPGQQVKAEILSTLSNHLYLARVAGELFKLEIPLVVQPGQSVPLTLVAVKPRVVFEVRRQGEGESVSLSFVGKRLSVAGDPDPADADIAIPAEVLPEGLELLPGFLPEGVEGEALPTVAEQQRSAAKLQLAPGEQVKGEIVRALPNNTYLVRVDGELFQVELPAQLEKGERVALTFLAAQPEVLFELQQRQGPGEPVRLSSLGKWLATPLKDGADAFPVQGPLVEHPAESGALLAGRLKEALTLRGLFYESHLAKWAAGALPLAEILKEPQGKLSTVRRHQPGAGEPEAPATGHGIADDRTLPLVREQLLLLNTRVLSWKGEPWPGQEMDLAVRESDGEEDAAVEATLALELPGLGGVRARLVMGAQGVAVELVAQRRESCEDLKGGRGDLLAATSAAGVPLSRVSVRHEEDE